MSTLDELLSGIQCPRCGRINTYAPRQVEPAFPVGAGSTVTVALIAGECSFCHEQVLDSVATERLRQAIEQALAGSDAVEPTGTIYQQQEHSARRWRALCSCCCCEDLDTSNCC
jgi:hypothetical protein